MDGPAVDTSQPGRASTLAALMLAGAVVFGCAATHHTVPPYRDDADAALALEARARDCCLKRREQTPPRPFVTDGCSAWFNLSWVGCCVEHDIAYWCGGTARERQQADRRFGQCVAKTNTLLSVLTYAAVRLGAPSWVPIHWRWGFGWPWPGH